MFFYIFFPHYNTVSFINFLKEENAYFLPALGISQ